MIQCSMCATWYHTDCVGLKKDTPVGIWPCITCRLIPEQIRTIATTLDALCKNVATLTEMNTLLSSQCATKNEECDTLRGENTRLKSEVASLTTKISKRSWEFYGKTTLLIGDSLIRGVNKNDFVNTSVKTISGAKIQDITNSIALDDTKYRKIVVCAGTNNSADDLNTEATSQQISDLIQTATKKVSDATDVVISGIPPRIDNIVRQHRVEEINTLLQDISAKTGNTYVSQDQSSRLANGQPNDGYIQNDGVHLNRHGCARLVANLGLVATPATVPSRQQKTTDPNDDEFDESQQFWQTAKTKASRSRRTNTTRQGLPNITRSTKPHSETAVAPLTYASLRRTNTMRVLC